MTPRVGHLGRLVSSGTCRSCSRLIRASFSVSISRSESAATPPSSGKRKPGYAVGLTQEDVIEKWSKFQYADTRAPLPRIGEGGQLAGFLYKKARVIHPELAFWDLRSTSGTLVQIAAQGEEAVEKLRTMSPHSPVVVQGALAPPTQSFRDAYKLTLHMTDIRQVNSFPRHLIVPETGRFQDHSRHLQLRFHRVLPLRLQFRSWLKTQLSSSLQSMNFTDIETPTLFKPTAEGAREFLVPTRAGAFYALAQSPQQYKQVLMAGGIHRYMQWARCYRDEDARADRQPEFTQLDMEWAFADAGTVMRDVEYVVLETMMALQAKFEYEQRGVPDGDSLPVPKDSTWSKSRPIVDGSYSFSTMTFADCMNAYGRDKPDLRIPSRIYAIEDLEPIKDFVGMITHLSDPLVECFRFSTRGTPNGLRHFLMKYMDGLSDNVMKNAAGAPHVLLCDSSKPLMGLSALGHAYSDVLRMLEDEQELEDGDLIVFQAREKPQAQFFGGSTALGNFRVDFWKALVDQGLMKPPPALGEPGSMKFVWVTEFPMFKPSEIDEPGQGNDTGFSSAHHPFTAPLSTEDLRLLFTDPLSAKAAAYDLVLNGNEIGGGSQRIHVADVQEFIMTDVLKIPEEGVESFSHLFKALRAGCPPHAGFALGFDRFTAILSGASNVRQVLAFPKGMRGKDLFTGAPTRVPKEKLAEYGLLRRRLTQSEPETAGTSMKEIEQIQSPTLAS